mmetsp:Transcript_21571/g.26701  ORF Transcript_21571/g.26701 Transcript_21571/m.26701 type:complete len:222 (-) Transcript_21571:58-723(-)|eukprot:CAMPEP_0172503752 /NCGR_PEP_ID=MMETSP1066-20121228/172048_1 /TAXON_ID=671091 /ORGANISM="Coscinodiscus wailesii, Strain CCMP2513" /LENGTH=221 /DNA_ID=CAMNT_0013279621 /DNA_START=44 /DNA_END=709 /DNA_ORIENTATION=+
MNAVNLLLTLPLMCTVNAFIHNPYVTSERQISTAPIKRQITVVNADATAIAEKVSVDPKEAAKLFGRLAEKYIMLDSSGGLCCYSACSDCEFRNPEGGYIMADQSASRPKWIPCYETREFESMDKSHTTKWSSEIFKDGPAVTKEQFIETIVSLPYAPILGGPYVGASAATIEDTTAASALFDALAGEKEKLTRHRMGRRMREFSGGEEGLVWKAFIAALT